MAAIQLACGFEGAGGNGSGVGGADSLVTQSYSYDCARQGKYGYALRASNAFAAGTIGTGTGATAAYSLSMGYYRFRVRLRSVGTGEDNFCALTNGASSGKTHLTVDPTGLVQLYAIPTNWASRIALGSVCTLVADQWYQFEWLMQWGQRAKLGCPEADVSAVASFIVVKESDYSQQTASFSAGKATIAMWFNGSDPAACGTWAFVNATELRVGHTNISGSPAYSGTRMDLDSVSASPNPAVVTPGGPNPLMYVPTRLPLTGTVSSGGWVLDGTAFAASYEDLNDLPPAGVAVGCITSATATDICDFTCGTPAAAGFGEADAYGVLLSVYLVSSSAVTHTLRIRIGGTLYTKTVTASGSAGWVQFWVPTQGLTPEFTSFATTSEIQVGFQKNGAAGTVRIQAFNVQVVGLQDWTPADDLSTTVSVMTGIYTGNGTSQAIPCDFEPHWIWTCPTAGEGTGAMWGESNQGAIDWTQIGQRTQQLNRTATGFVVSGNDVQTNQTTTGYRWFAIRDGTQRLLYRGAFSEAQAAAYTLDDGLGVIPATFGTPVAVWAHIDAYQAPGGVAAYFRGTQHTGTNSSSLTAAVLTANGVRTMPAAGSGFQVGPLLTVSSNPQTGFSVWSLGFVTTTLWAITTYTGNGAATQAVTLALGGRAPGWVLVIPQNGGGRYHRHASHTGLNSVLLSNGALSTSGVTAVAVNQLTAGSSINSNGILYDVIALAVPDNGGSFLSDVVPAVGACAAQFGTGSDSGGGAGCRPYLGAGSDSGGSAGCRSVGF